MIQKVYFDKTATTLQTEEHTEIFLNILRNTKKKTHTVILGTNQERNAAIHLTWNPDQDHRLVPGLHLRFDE